MRIFSLIAFMIFMTSDGFGQVFLQLNRYGNPEPKRFHINEKLSYQDKNFDDHWFSQKIHEFIIPDSLIIFTEGAIKVNTIKSIKIYKPIAKSIGNKLTQFGVLWMTYGTIAHFYNKDANPWDGRVWGVGLGTIASGWLTKKLFYSKTYSINNKNRLKIMDLRF